jgi:hypothetical protein
MTMSAGVSECTVSGSKVTVKMAASSVDFFVVVNRAAAWTSTGSFKISAELKNYGSKVQETDNASGKQMALTAAKTAMATDTTLVVEKTLHNTMDTGSLRFKVTFKKLATWGATNHAFVEFPSYYKPNVGEYLTCAVEDSKKVQKELLYCEMRWDFSLKIWGPAVKAVA